MENLTLRSTPIDQLDELKSVTWPILASLIGQLQRWVKFYAGIFLRIGDVNLYKKSCVDFYSMDGIDQLEKLKMAMWLIWLVEFQRRVNFYSKIF